MPVLSPIAVLPGDASHADHARLVVERRVEEPSEWLAARFDRTQFVVERPPLMTDGLVRQTNQTGMRPLPRRPARQFAHPSLDDQLAAETLRFFGVLEAETMVAGDALRVVEHLGER